MSARQDRQGRQRAANSIRGPQSALTDYLAANNISANQIRLDYISRQRQAEQAEDADDNAGEGSSAQAAEVAETPEAQKKRKRKEDLAISKIKKSKEFARRKKQLAGEPGEDDDDEIALDMYQKAKPLPGQLENCEICSKRFTVTPYNKEGPKGGLCCTKCSKEREADKKKEQNKRKSAVNRDKRRKLQSNLIDGLNPYGVKSLREHCIEMVAANIKDVDEFGDLPPNLLDRLSQILSKRRVLNSRTLDLFLRPDMDKICVYDCGNLETNDFKRMFAISPTVEHLTLENAGQFKDEAVDYMLEKRIPLRSLKLEAANLITDAKWKELFTSLGPNLEELKLTWLDSSMDDAAIEELVKNSPNLKYLKLKKCFRITEASMPTIARLKKLEQLYLRLTTSPETDTIDSLIQAVGLNLRALSLQKFDNASDSTLQIIRNTCSKLTKLRFTENDYCTDLGFAALFEGWDNPPLQYINLSDDREMGTNEPENPQATVGLADEGFKALMKHSGSKLERLNVKSCRHITNAILLQVFDGEQQYPMLKEIDFSFVSQIDNSAIAGIFKSCPSLERLVAFGCFEVKEVPVPPGVALIGVPYVQDTIVQEGKFLQAILDEVSGFT